MQYPNAPYHVDFGSGAVLNKFQAIRQKRLNVSGWPDVMIAMPLHGYSGLFIELKREGTTFYKKNGEPYSSFAHQHKMHETLRMQGYRVEVGIGFDDTASKIKTYFSGIITELSLQAQHS